MTEKTAPVRGLTQDMLDKLGAPVPDSEKKTRKGFNNKDLTYTSTEFVEDRASSVDLSWESHYTDNKIRNKYGVVGTMFCELTIMGVTRSGSAGYFVPDDVSYTDRDGNKKTRMVNNDDVHTITSAAQARAKKRAAAEHTIARELWMDTNETRAAASQSSGTTQYAQSSNGAVKLASDKQKDMLFEGFYVPKDVTALLTGGKYDPNVVVEDGMAPAGQASRLFSELREAKSKHSDYADNANFYIRQALTAIKPEAAKLIPAGVAPATNDFDDPD